MSSGCQEYQETMVAAGLDELSPALREHLERCPECAALAPREQRLWQHLESALAEDDERLQARIVAALPRRSYSWMPALLPLAASLAVALLGAVLMGGVPGGDLLAHLPSISSAGLVALGGVLTDWAVAMGAVARTGSTAIPDAVGWSALMLALAGLMLLGTTAARWRRAWAWR